MPWLFIFGLQILTPCKFLSKEYQVHMLSLYLQTLQVINAPLAFVIMFVCYSDFLNQGGTLY